MSEEFTRIASALERIADSLDEAQAHLRNALAYAARTEKPYISKHIADMMSNIDNIINIVPILEKIEDGLTD